MGFGGKVTEGIAFTKISSDSRRSGERLLLQLDSIAAFSANQ